MHVHSKHNDDVVPTQTGHTSAVTVLLQPKPFRLINRNHHHLVELLLGRVRREIEPIEARVTAG